MRGFPARIRRWAAVAAGALALYALLGFVVVPRVAKAQLVRLARTRLHREARVADVACNPFTLTATVTGFALADRDGVPLLSFDRLTLDLEAAGAFRRAWRFREVRLDAPVVSARILADGRPSVADLLEPSSPPARATADSGPVRLIVDRLTLADGRVAFEDASRTPAYRTTFEPLAVDLRDLTTIPREAGDHAVSVRLEGGAEIRWEGRQTLDPLRLEGRIELADARVWKLWELAGLALPIEAREGTVDVAFSYLVERGSDGALRAALADGAVTVSDLAVHPRGGDERWLAVERLAVAGVRLAWPERTLAVAEVRCLRPAVLARRSADGALNWMAALPSHPPDPAAPAAAAPAPPWSGRVEALVVEGGAVRLEDGAVSPPMALTVSDVALRLDGISTDLAAPITVEASARLLGAGSVSLRGTAVPAGPAADVEVAADALELVPLQPYLGAPGPARLAAGAAGARGTMTLRPAPGGLTWEGAAWLTAPELVSDGGQRLLASRSLRADGVRLTTAPPRLRVRTVAIDGGFAAIHIDRERNLNLAMLAGGAPPAGTPAAAAAAPALPVYVGTVRFSDAAVDFSDASLILPFATQVHALKGTVTDLATAGAAPARVALEGRIDETGFATLDGTLRVADPFAATDLRVVFRSLSMDRLTPYAAEFAGYAIERGALDLDLRYRLTDRRLLGEHRVVARDLVLGKRVEGTEAGLAVRLAIALLKDKDGRIDLDVPVEGSVDEPEFAYRTVMWQAVRIILGNIVKAPFRALGRLFGGGDDELELVGFEPGRAALIPPEREKLSRLAGELAGRAELALAVEGRFDPAADAGVLRADALEAMIEQRRVATADAAAGSGVLDAILEALYAEAFGADALAAERARFTAAPAPPPEPERQGGRAARRKAAQPAPQPAPGTFDAEGFYDALRARLLAAQPVGDAALAALARARAAAVAAAITADGRVDPARVTALEPAPVKRTKRADTGLVASEMTLSVPD